MATNVKRTQVDGTIVIDAGATVATNKLFVVGEVVCLSKEAMVSGTPKAAFIKDIEVEYAKLSTDTVTTGIILYFDGANDRLTITAASLKKAGIAGNAAGSGVATCRLHLGVIR